MRAEVTGFLFVVAAAVATAADPPSLELTVAEGPFRVGDRVAVQIVARGGGEVLWGAPGAAVGDGNEWMVAGPPRELAGSRPPAWEMILVPMAVGDLDLPPIEVTVRDDAGSRSVRPAEPPAVTVETVLPDNEDPEPAPIRDPLGVSGFPWEWIVPAMVPALVVTALLAAWGRRLRAADGSVRRQPLPPLDELESLLDRLATRIGREPAEGLCDQLAYGVRLFLQRQSERPAVDMTSFEVRQLVREMEWPEPAQRGVPVVMSTVDRVRFARRPADDPELREILALARGAARCIEDDRRRREAEAGVEAVQ